jgi:roadblock/LC7 domain-containing protein
MNLISELASTPGVLAAGEYSYRGDRFSYEGNIDSEQARLASIMCRATTMATHMQTDMLSQFAENCGCSPSRGWVVKGKDYTVCVMLNVFCFVDNKNASINDVVKKMQAGLGDKTPDMV